MEMRMIKEWRVLFHRKRTLFCLLLLLLGSWGLGFLAVEQQERVYINGTIMQGQEIYERMELEQKKRAGAATQEHFDELLVRLRKKGSNLSSSEERINDLFGEDYFPYRIELNFLIKILAQPQEPAFAVYDRLYQQDHIDVYALWKQQVIKQAGTLTKGQMESLQMQLNQVEIPFSYEAGNAYRVWMQKFPDFLLLNALVYVILFASLFSKDVQTHADQVIMTCKFGRRSLNQARLFSAFCFTSLCFFLSLFMYTGRIASLISFAGSSTSIQLGLCALSPYALSMLQACMICLLFSYVAQIGITTLTILCSKYSKKAFHVIFLLFLFLFASYMKLQVGEFSFLDFILPFSMSDANVLFVNGMQAFGNKMIWVPGVALVLELCVYLLWANQIIKEKVV